MSFFIRKKPKGSFNNLTRPAGGDGTAKPRNKDYKPRPAANNKKRPLGGKRKKQPFLKDKTEKRRRFDKDEEIASSTSEEEEDLLESSLGKGKLHRPDESQSQEEFFSAEEFEDADETAQEKKLRLAKLYLEEIEKQEKSRREEAEVDSDLIASRLKEDVLESEGRLRREIADSVEPDLDNMFVLSCSKHLKRSVTCLCITEDDLWIFSGSKDGHIFKWSVKEKKRVAMVRKKEVLSKKQKKRGKKKGDLEEDPNASHSSAITSVAVSSDSKFLASGDEDGKVVIWDPETLKRIHIFTGHRGAIKGLVFRKKKHALYSASADRSVRIWDLDAMGYVESLFGHQDAVTCIDALSRERCVTGGGRDNTIRVWKIVEESQLVYNGHYSGTIDSVRLVNEENFVSCGDDGLLCSWNVNRKKPLFTQERPHGSFKSFPESEIETPRWISALAAWTNTDLIASGSSDGFVRFWKCGERFKSLTEAFSIPIQGWVNVMEFSVGAECTEEALDRRPKLLVIGTGKEHRLGRWFQDSKEAKNGIVVVPLKHKSSKSTIPNITGKGTELNNVSSNVNALIAANGGSGYPMTDDDSS